MYGAHTLVLFPKPLKLSCECSPQPAHPLHLTRSLRKATSSAKPRTFGTSPDSKSPTRRSSSVSPISLPCLVTNRARARARMQCKSYISPSTEKNSSPRGFRAILYSTGKDPSKEKWDGASTRFVDVVSLFGADDARPLDNFADDLRAFVARAEHVYVDLPASSPNSNSAHHNNRHARYHHHHHPRRRVVGSGTRFPSLFKYLSRQPSSSSSFDDNDQTGSYMDVIASSMSLSKRKPLAPLVGALRSVKSECEVEVMKASAEISARAHAKVGFVFIMRGGMWFTDKNKKDDAFCSAWAL